MDNLTFGQRLVAFRTKSGLLQKELAAKIGLSPTALNHYEKDNREPTVLTINALAKALGVTGNDLLGIEDTTIYLTQYEQELIRAYREAPVMHPAIEKILELKPNTVTPRDTVRMFHAAKSEDNKEGGIVEMPRAVLDKLRNAPAVTSNDDI